MRVNSLLALVAFLLIAMICCIAVFISGPNLIIPAIAVLIAYIHYFRPVTIVSGIRQSPDRIIASVVSNKEWGGCFTLPTKLQNLSWRPRPTVYYFYSIPGSGPFMSWVKHLYLRLGAKLTCYGMDFVVVVYGKGIDFHLSQELTQSQLRAERSRLLRLLQLCARQIRGTFPRNTILRLTGKGRIRVVLADAWQARKRKYVLSFIGNRFLLHVRTFYGEAYRQATLLHNALAKCIELLHQVGDSPSEAEEAVVRNEVRTSLEGAIHATATASDRCVVELRVRVGTACGMVGTQPLQYLWSTLHAIEISPLLRPERVAHSIAYAANCLPVFLSMQANDVILCWRYSFGDEYFGMRHHPLLVRSHITDGRGQPVPADIVESDRAVLLDDSLEHIAEIVLSGKALDSEGLIRMTRLLSPHAPGGTCLVEVVDRKNYNAQHFREVMNRLASHTRLQTVLNHRLEKLTESYESYAQLAALLAIVAVQETLGFEKGQNA